MAVSIALRDYLRRRAAWVWNEQTHAFDHGLSLQEETLTEMLLLRMARDHSTNGLTVRMFSKPEEAVNGADWEWIIQTPTCDIGLRIQAKRLYHKSTGKDYGGLSLTPTQIDKLIAQAGTSIPIYVFFNHPYGVNSGLLNGGGEKPYRGRSFWGCAVANAHAVKAAKSNSLAKLRNCMKPWHRMLSDTGGCDIHSSLGLTPAAVEGSMPATRREVVERIGDRDFMLTYLAQNDLSGVAVINFTDFRG